MNDTASLITEHIDTWTSAQAIKTKDDGKKSLVEINEEHRFIKIDPYWEKDMELDLNTLYEQLQPEGIDRESLNLIQVLDLHEVVDYSMTKIGSGTILRSLMQPISDLKRLQAKQRAVRELEENPELRLEISNYLESFAKHEKALWRFLNNIIDRKFSYLDFRNAMKAATLMVKGAKAISQPKSEYLLELLKTIIEFGESIDFRLARGPIFRTFNDLKSSEDISIITPRWRCRPRFASEGTLIPLAPAAIEIIGLITGFIEWNSPMSNLICNIAFPGALISYFHATMVKPKVDYSTVIKPMRERLVENQLFTQAVDAVGKLDELHAFGEFSRNIGHETSIPEFTDKPTHLFKAVNIRNPVQASQDKSYIPNDVKMENIKLTFITGPNSGGKTSYCKSIIQNQLLAQAGCYVLAKSAQLTLADFLAYQAPKFDALQDEQGRFGTELKRTKEIFFKVSPMSLIIIDELAEGTTLNEKILFSNIVLDALHRIGNNTIMVTHHHELVESFLNQGKGQDIQVEFKDGIPTHRVIKGISTDSHAARVAKEIGFSAEDIDSYLKSKGY